MIANLTPFTTVLSHYKKHDPTLHKALSTLNLSDWLTDHTSSDHFYNLTRNIIYQQLAGAAASTIFGRFQQLVGEVNVQAVLAASDSDMRKVGLSWAKVRYVKDLAHKLSTGEVTLDNLDSLDNESIITELTKVSGIGRWTAEMFLLFTLHRENIFSYGDLGLKKGFAKLYNQEASPANLIRVVSRWDPYQSYGCLALWHYLDNS